MKQSKHSNEINVTYHKYTYSIVIVILILTSCIVGVLLHKLISAKVANENNSSKTYVHDYVVTLDDLEAGIAEFIIPVNYTVNGPWTRIELKASDSNFSHGITNSVPETEFMLYYMDSDLTDNNLPAARMRRAIPSGVTKDNARLYVLNRQPGDDGLELRSYKRILNTVQLAAEGWHVQELIVLVDASCLRRHPQDPNDRSTVWLLNTNEDLVWEYSRQGIAEHEVINGARPLWRPIAPVRWFKKMPGWAQAADAEFEELTTEEEQVVEE